MGAFDAAISTNAVEPVRIVTNCVTLKSSRIRTYEREFKSMKTMTFKPRRMRTYDDCVCNLFGMRSYEKDGRGGGSARKERAGRWGDRRSDLQPHGTQKKEGII
jgi:hypothetical protein